MNRLLTLSRWFVGVLFIFSGLVKANDPLGLSYKMQEFFEVWQLGFLDPYTFAFSIAMITFEIIAGVAIIIGWQFRVFSWLIFLLIVFFTFLTGYAVLSGKVKECGCFGDCIPLTATQSFTKDLILLVIVSWLLIKRNHITSSLHARSASILLIASTIATIYLQFYALEYLPPLDCLPYKKGADINEQMKIPANAIPDSTVITFVYQKEGKEVEFDTEHFPEDFNDSLYVFVRRYDKLIRKGNAEPAIKDFVIMTAQGVDTTSKILNDPREMWVIFIRKIDSGSFSWINAIQKINSWSINNDRPVIVITPQYEDVANAFNQSKIQLPVYKGDLVAIKTAARSNPTLYKLQQGVILGKWGRGDLLEPFAIKE